MFEVGDIVILRNESYNKGIELKYGERYTIENITYNDDFICDIYLVEYTGQPYYHIRFELDPLYERQQKILKLKQNINGWDSKTLQ